MIRKGDLLDNVRIASPCPARWSEMEGDDQMRHCQLCKHNVYDISAMTRDEAEKFLREASGRVCVHLYRRSDGRILTSDCHIGKKTIRKRLLTALATAAFIFLAGLTKAETMIGIADPENTLAGRMAQRMNKALQKVGLLTTPTPPPPPPVSHRHHSGSLGFVTFE